MASMVFCVGDAVDTGVPAIEQHDLVVGEFTPEFDRRRGASCDARDLLPGLFDGGRGVDAP